tara:strand:+ start:347 stop:589 length:243 start_codon:yes stop_codon:yes gene_type:complete
MAQPKSVSAKLTKMAHVVSPEKRKLFVKKAPRLPLVAKAENVLSFKLSQQTKLVVVEAPKHVQTQTSVSLSRPAQATVTV